MSDIGADHVEQLERAHAESCRVSHDAVDLRRGCDPLIDDAQRLGNEGPADMIDEEAGAVGDDDRLPRHSFSEAGQTLDNPGCGSGAADYLAIAQAYHTVIVVGIPVMGRENRDQAIRFTKLIDALYENNVKLFAAAAAEPEDLYPEGDGSFEFARTVSRLEEMQSADYMARGHGLAEA